MPRALIEPRWQARPETMDMHDWLKAAACHFRVSAIALKWRLNVLGLLSAEDLAGIKDARLAASTKSGMASSVVPPAFSRRFLERMAWAITRGELSVRRLANLLEFDVSELKALFTEHGLNAPFEL